MGTSTINFSKFLADPFSMRGMTNDQTALMNEINQSRLPELAMALDAGETVDVELGCGEGEFAAKLSDRTQRWVIGIDMEPERIFTLSREGWPGHYMRSKRFLYLPYSYEFVLRDQQQMFGWLEGKAEKTFMIMPDPQRAPSFKEEAGLWMKLAVPRGELHMKTEEKWVLDMFEDTIQRPCELIPFWKGADDIPSQYLRDLIYPAGSISCFHGNIFTALKRFLVTEPGTIIRGRGFRLSVER